MAFGHGVTENHLAGEASHLCEIGGYCGETVEDNLAERRLVVGNQTYVLADFKFLLLGNSNELYEIQVILSGQEKIDLAFLYRVKAHLVRESDLYAVFIAKAFDPCADEF